MFTLFMMQELDPAGLEITFLNSFGRVSLVRVGIPAVLKTCQLKGSVAY